MRHHDDTIAGYVDSVAERSEVLGVVVIGSVARGTPRDDSDVDVYLVVDDDAYADARARGRIAAVSQDGVTYPGGYVDIKLASPHYLTSAITGADDPTRASFTGAKVVLDKTGELADWVAGITILPDEVWKKRTVAYRAQTRLYGGYFLKQADQLGDHFLLNHSAVHLALSAGRLALAQHQQFFSGQKYLTADLERLDLPDRFTTSWRHVVAAPSAAIGQHLLDAIVAWLGPPEPFEAQLSRFIADNELAWLNGTIPPEFW
ncbi:MAG TPA: nucleotidyltransferase domain-containing protein [Microlunatus sp.]|nr:nucleotidyltransferase domain-containing protein [Microlunatus sp.]